MEIELKNMRLKVESEVGLPVFYHGCKITEEGFRLDLLVLLRQFTKSPLFPLCQRGKLLSPSLAKRGEGRFSDQTAQHIRLASRHKRYLSE